MVFDGSLIATGNKDHVGDACCISLFNSILNQRLINNGQHFLGHGLRRRQKARTKTCYGKNDFTNFFHDFS